MDQTKIRNIAIIAHVDHGKTTLVDHLLKQSHTFLAYQAEMNQDTILDSNDLERERSITILAKNTAIRWHDYKINIIDTPGHADFSGEVERVLNMAEGCILLVDAAEGVLSQTRYVLSLALKLGLQPIVIINKVDRKDQRAEAVLNEINDLFVDLAENADQLEFPVLYAIGRQGIVGTQTKLNPDHSSTITDAEDLSLLFKTIIDTIPAPKGDSKGATQIQITNLDFDSHKGRFSIGKINRGIIKLHDTLAVVRDGQKISQSQVGYLFTFKGLSKEAIEVADTGDIIALAGFKDVQIGDTLTDPNVLEGLPGLNITPPILKIELSVSTSPLVGQDGKLTTSRQIGSRLNQEIETNVSLKITPGVSGNSFVVAGRGELHLSILIETMRREGFEFSVSRPEVIFKEVDGHTLEPYEKLYVEVPEKYSGTVINSLGQRKAVMLNMVNMKSGVRFEYKISTRHLIGLRGDLLSQTSGACVVNSEFLDYEPKGEDLSFVRNGAIVSDESGQALSYSIANLQVRGMSFVDPGDVVYRGMVVGMANRQGDMHMNVCKGKQKTNVRSVIADQKLQITPALKMSLEQYLTFISSDELLEVTPKFLRLRKKDLNFKR